MHILCCAVGGDAAAETGIEDDEIERVACIGGLQLLNYLAQVGDVEASSLDRCTAHAALLGRRVEALFVASPQDEPIARRRIDAGERRANAARSTRNQYCLGGHRLCCARKTNNANAHRMCILRGMAEVQAG